MNRKIPSIVLLFCVSASAAACGGVANSSTLQPKVTLAVTVTTSQAPTAPVSLAALSTVSQPAAHPTSSSQTQFVQLTTGGCCVQPFFSPDNAQVLYLDKPSPDAPAGIYGVPVTQPMATPTLFTALLGPFSRDMSLAADLENGQTVVRKRSDDTRWVINNGGRSVSFSPDNRRIAWNVSQDSGNFDVRRSEIWVANSDGSAAKRVLTRYGGGIQGWLSDSQRFLVGGKANRNDATGTLSIFDLSDGSLRDVYSADRMRGFLLSPDSRWLVFFIAQSRQSEQNGLYVLRLDEANAQPQRMNWFGAYRWGAPGELLYVPLKPNAASSELWQLNPQTGATKQLISASADSPFKIGNGDWDISSDGKHVIYVNARDRNIWLINL